MPKYAGWLLNYAEEVQQTHGHLQLRRCGPQVQHALELTGHAANRICAQRLIPMLLASLESHEHIQISEQCHCNGFVLAPGGHMLTPLPYGSPQASTHASFRLSPCFSAYPWQ